MSSTEEQKPITIGHMILGHTQTAELPPGAEVIQISLLPHIEAVSIVYRI